MINEILGAAMYWAFPALGLFSAAVLAPGGLRRVLRGRRP